MARFTPVESTDGCPFYCVVIAGVFERADRPSTAPTKRLRVAVPQVTTNNTRLNQILSTFGGKLMYPNFTGSQIFPRS